MKLIKRIVLLCLFLIYTPSVYANDIIIDKCEDLIGEYISDYDSSEVFIKRDKENNYAISIMLFRLIQIDNALGYCKGSQIKFLANVSEDMKISGFFSKENDKYLLGINKSDFEYLTNEKKYFFRKK